MELAVLATGIDSFGKLAQKIAVDLAPHERLRQFAGVDAAGDRSKPAIEKRLDQLSGIALPDGKDRLHPEFRKVLFTIGAQVFQKNVAKSNGANAAPTILVELTAHLLLIL